MKKFILSSLLVLITSICFSQKITTVILIRHAEKIISSDSNPDLSEKGEKRVANLERFFEAVRISSVYSTDYLRTKNTVASIAKQKGLEVKIYDPRDLETFARSLAEEHAGQTILVAGHSNTTPKLVSLLGGEDSFEKLDETEYDWVYIVDMMDLGYAHVKKLKVVVE